VLADVSDIKKPPNFANRRRIKSFSAEHPPPRSFSIYSLYTVIFDLKGVTLSRAICGNLRKMVLFLQYLVKSSGN